MTEFSDNDFKALERRRTRELEELEARHIARREAQRARMRRTHRRRRAAAVGFVVVVILAIAGAFTLKGGGSNANGSAPLTTTTGTSPATTHHRSSGGHLAMPAALHGIHISMFTAADANKLGTLLSTRGLNAVEIDVKDEHGYVAFRDGVPKLALRSHATGAANFYDPKRVIAAAHAAGMYVIGRIVSFEDPTVAPKFPNLAIRTTNGGVWTNNAGVAWANPYSVAYQNYLLGIARAAAKAGFDEIQFDYMRFPTDGPIQDAVFPGAPAGHLTETRMAHQIYHFLSRARAVLHPLGVKDSVDVFGLAANRSEGIGQDIRQIAPVVDAISPMAYPSHYGPGEYNIQSPINDPYDVIVHTMGDFRDAVSNTHTKLRPWLQDFSIFGVVYTDRQVEQQIAAADKSGASGWLLWNPTDVYHTGALATH